MELFSVYVPLWSVYVIVEQLCLLCISSACIYIPVRPTSATQLLADDMIIWDFFCSNHETSVPGVKCCNVAASSARTASWEKFQFSLFYANVSRCARVTPLMKQEREKRPKCQRSKARFLLGSINIQHTHTHTYVCFHHVWGHYTDLYSFPVDLPLA